MSTFPGTIDSYNVIGTTNYMDEGGYVLHDHLNQHGSAVVNIENVLGTTAGTSVLKDFTAGEFAIARNSGGTVTDTLTKGTANNFVLGTPAITGGTANNQVVGTPAITGGTANNQVLGTPTITTPNLILANTTTMTTDGGIVYDRTNEKLLIGDGTNTQSITMGAWTAWSPTPDNLTVGNGTLTCKYIRVGKLVIFHIMFTFGDTSSVSGVIDFPLPANQSEIEFEATAAAFDQNTSIYYPMYSNIGNNKVYLYAIATGSTYATWTATSSSAPFTWTTSDQIIINGYYQST